MKELSIEQKAKRYEEAIERANELNYVSDKDSLQHKTVEHIFPELKESEDERIMGNIIAAIHLYYGEPLEDEAKEMIAWLEKQGEQKHADKVEPKFRIGDVIEVKPMKCHGKIFTGEPNKIIDITEESYILDDGKAYSIELQDGWKLSEQKPAWSEEDEDVINHLLAICAVVKRYRQQFAGCSQEDITKYQTWLKSLKDRVLPQPKQEWSEEDKNMLQSILDEYKSMPIEKRNWLKSLKDRVQPKQEWSEKDEDRLDIIFERIEHGLIVDKDDLDLLKSLKGRYTWKPSDEQMRALKEAVDEHFDIDGGALWHLYEDLKKLKG